MFFWNSVAFSVIQRMLAREKGDKGEHKTEGEKKSINNKVNDLNPCTSVISLNNSGFSIPIKR